MGPHAQARSDVPMAASAAAMSELDRLAAAALDKINTENFPVALRVLPARARDHLRRAYVYARFVDDVGDRAAGDRLALLDLVDQDVQRLAEATARLAPVRGLAPLVADGLSLQPLRDLVEANRRDQLVDRYATFDDLLDYCRLSAAPVGRMVLAIARVDDAMALVESDNVCAALQVLEHCQDVGEDFAAGRVYLPAVDLDRFHVSDEDLRGTVTSAGLRRVIELETARAEQLLGAGRPLIRRLHRWARLAVIGYVAGGRATVSALRRADYDVLAGPVKPTKLDTVRHAAQLTVTR